MAKDCCDPVPDSAMATGNDDDEPGGGPEPPPLEPDEQALLDTLTHDRGGPPLCDAEEDSPAVQRAVEEDSVVPSD
jgi:hypothetical protein